MGSVGRSLGLFDVYDWKLLLHHLGQGINQMKHTLHMKTKLQQKERTVNSLPFLNLFCGNEIVENSNGLSKASVDEEIKVILPKANEE